MTPRWRLWATLMAASAASCARDERRPVRIDVPAPAPSASSVASAPEGARVAVPGTGVSLVPPTGVKLAPIGTTLTDETGSILVSIAIGSVAHSPDTAAPWLSVFAGEPEPVRVGALSGELRHRQRERSDGPKAFDAWALVVKSETSALTVMITDKSPDPDRWKRWKANILTIEWKPEEVDAERSFGLTAGAIPGMTLEKVNAGGLMYRAAPPDAESITLLLSSLPLVLPDAPEPCFEVLRKSAFDAVKSSAPVAFESRGFGGCEMESTNAKGKVSYVSLVRVPDAGGIVFAIGEAPAAAFPAWRPRFAAAIRGLRPTR